MDPLTSMLLLHLLDAHLETDGQHSFTMVEKMPFKKLENFLQASPDYRA